MAKKVYWKKESSGSSKKKYVFTPSKEPRIPLSQEYMDGKIGSIVNNSPYYKKHGKYPGLTPKMVSDWRKRQKK